MALLSNRLAPFLQSSVERAFILYQGGSVCWGVIGRETENGLSEHTPSLAFSHSHFEQILIALSGVPLAFLDAELGAGERDVGS